MAAVTGTQLAARVQVLADIVGSDFLQSSELSDLVNDGISALWADATAVNKDLRVSSAPFTITSSASPFMPGGLTPLVPGFREVRAVRRDPGLSTQRYLQRFALRVGSMSSELSYRLQDTNLYIEPMAQAPGNYELLYIPTPLLVGQSDADTVLITAGSPLPAYTPSGIGVTHQLTAVANGALLVDGVALAVNTVLIVNDEAADTTQNGLYITLQPGTAGTPFILRRVKRDILGSTTKITSGVLAAGHFFRLTTFTGFDVGPIQYTEQGIDAELAQFQDYVVLHATIAALAKEETPADQFGAMFDEAQKRVQRWAASQRSADPNLIEDVRRGGGSFGGVR